MVAHLVIVQGFQCRLAPEPPKMKRREELQELFLLLQASLALTVVTLSGRL